MCKILLSPPKRVHKLTPPTYAVLPRKGSTAAMQYQAKLQSCACLLVPKTNIIRTALPAALVLDFSCLFPNPDQYTTLLQLITNSAEQTPESA